MSTLSASKRSPARFEAKARSARVRFDTMEFLRIGIHTSRAVSLERAALKAAELGANTFQIFSASPRMWRASPPGEAEIKLLLKARERFDLHPLVIHANYLINLASSDPAIRGKSIAAFRGELERASSIGAEFLVLHPGNYKELSPAAGIENFADGLLDASAGLRPGSVTILLENTVGCGSQLGGRLEELRAIRDLASARSGFPIGYCLDTCHLFASGFDVANAVGLNATLTHAERILGMENVKVIHANDSKKPLGSRRDRHENIGEGHIGLNGFRRMLHHPKLRAKPFILETPVDREGGDRRNVETLLRLAARRISPREIAGGGRAA
jgi:deoxyribonuclease IV